MTKREPGHVDVVALDGGSARVALLMAVLLAPRGIGIEPQDAACNHAINITPMQG